MLQSDWLVQISLGTSDTVFLWITTAEPQLTGHVFINPVDKNAFMALLWWVTTYMVYRYTVKHYVINNLVTISSMETDKLPGLTFSPTSIPTLPVPSIYPCPCDKCIQCGFRTYPSFSFLSFSQLYY